MRKITSLLVLFCMCVGMAWGQDVYRPGARTTTLEVGKKYFIGAATFYNNARYNLLYNNGGDLTYSETKPNAIIDNASYLFTVEELGDNNTYYVKNSDGKYLLFDNKTSTEAKTSITVVPYASVKGSKTCGDDVQACDENGNKIEYNAITNETPVVCVYDGTSEKGWRHINGLEVGRPTPFAFYEVEKTSFVEVTTKPETPIYYTIKNVRCGKYVTYAGDNKQLKEVPGISPDALFYFTAGTATADGQQVVKIHNYSSDAKCAGHNSWTEEGIDWYINLQAKGFSIANSKDASGNGTSWNDAGGFGKNVAYWNGSDPGSAWEIVKYEGEIPTFKTSTENNIVLCQMNPLRQSSLVNFVGHNQKMTQVYTSELGTYWYFMVDEAEQANAPEGVMACKIFSPLHETGVENHGSGYMGDASWPAKTYYIQKYEDNGYKGYVIYPKGSDGGWHDNGGTNIVNWTWQNEGSIWNIFATDKTIDQVRNDIKALINNLDAPAYLNACEEADFYTVSDEVLAEAKAKVTPVDNNAKSYELYATYLSHKQAKETLVAAAKGKTAPAAGQYIQLKNKQYGKYLKPTDAGGLTSVADGNDWATLWLVVEGTDGNVMLQNASTKKYIGEIRQSANVAMVEETNAKQFAFTNQADCYAVFKETTGGDHAYGHIAGHNVLVGWNVNANATQWIVSEVTLEESLADLQEIYKVVDNAFGTEPGQYKEMEPSPSDELYAAWAYAGEVLGNDEAKDVYVMSILASDLKAKWNTQLANPDSREINLPVQGKFYRLKNVASGRYMNVKDASNVVVTDEGENLPATIFYLGENNTMLSYSLGQYLDCGNKNLAAVGTSKSGEFAAARSGAKPNTIMYKNNGYWTFGNRDNDASIDRGSNKPGANVVGYDWVLEEVTELPVTITAAGYASFYAPVEVTLPEGVTAHTVTENGEWATLSDAISVVPAKNGVILAGNAGTYNLTVSNEGDENLTNALSGTVAKTLVTKEAGAYYVLGVVDGAVGLYNPVNGEDNNTFYNAGFKAYWYIPAVSQTAGFRFGGETTAIDAVEVENANAPIYDLSGRRVLSTVKGGVYIQNGKKFIVK